MLQAKSLLLDCLMLLISAYVYLCCGTSLFVEVLFLINIVMIFVINYFDIYVSVYKIEIKKWMNIIIIVLEILNNIVFVVALALR